uniref:Lysosome-associated membrane glycoprotein 5 n=1 Tax=Aceria tosichella TaxID=561515 RepID=A0A6G1SCZ8_9ACAR
MASQRLLLKRIIFLLLFCAFIIAKQSSSLDVNRVTVDQATNEAALDGALSYLAPKTGQETSSGGGGSSSSASAGQRRNASPRRTNRTKSNRTMGQRRPTVRRIVHPSLHAAWDESNHLCALAKFQATFTIKYDTSSGSTSQLIDKMPLNARSKGRCDQFDDEPVLDIMWKDIHQSSFSNSQQNNSTLGFTFRIIFQKYTEDDDRWGIQQMQLLYNTGHSVFHGVSAPKKFIVRSNKDDYRLQFRTTFGRSVLCPSPPPIQMYDSDGTLRVIARLSNMQLQAFEFSDSRQGANFDEFERCGQVSFGSGVARQNLKRAKYDGLTFTIGLMTCCIAGLTVVGYAIYRSNYLKTKQYKTMED